MILIKHKSKVFPHLDILNNSELFELSLDVILSSFSVQRADPNLSESLRVRVTPICPISAISLIFKVVSIILTIIIVSLIVLRPAIS